VKRFLTSGIRVALCLAALASPAKNKIVIVPPHCVEVDRFYKPCHPAKYGGYDCQVHISVKHDPDCQQYDHRELLQVPR
jgi:hypothetical protein